MSLLAEQLVDEWMNRHGFFTVRGAKEGVDEVDLLGVRPSSAGLDAWHVEVQVSFRPIAYISKLSKEDMESFGVKNKNSAKKRGQELLEKAVQGWVTGKFDTPKKRKLRNQRWPDLNWERILVHGEVKDKTELGFIEKQGVRLVNFKTVLLELKSTGNNMRGQTGTDILDILLFYESGAADEA